MTNEEAMTLALDALNTVEWHGAGGCWIADGEAVDKAITSLHQTIEQAEKQEPVYQIKVYGSKTAWHDAGSSAYDLTSPDERRILYTHPQPKAEQEPVAWMREGWGPDCGPYIEFYSDDEMGWRDRKEWTPLYTSPQPQKPLSVKELNLIAAQWHLNLLNDKDKADVFAAFRAIEAAHNIKGDA